MSPQIRQEQADAFGPEPCVACAAAARELKADEGGKSVVVVDPKKKSWIAIELVDEVKKPAAHATYRVKLPDGVQVEGHLDRRGKVRLEGIAAGNCVVSFPDVDAKSGPRA